METRGRKTNAERGMCTRGHRLNEPITAYRDRRTGTLHCRECERMARSRARIGLPVRRANQLEMGVCAGAGHILTPDNHHVYRYPREGRQDRIVVRCLDCAAERRGTKRAASVERENG